MRRRRRNDGRCYNYLKQELKHFLATGNSPDTHVYMTFGSTMKVSYNIPSLSTLYIDLRTSAARLWAVAAAAAAQFLQQSCSPSEPSSIEPSFYIPVWIIHINIEWKKKYYHRPSVFDKADFHKKE